VAKLTNEILSKLTTSIDKNVAALVANPVSALQLQRGFKSVDIKKSYRALVLKYHPGEADRYDITMFVGS
jgi:preprotein translocase subunit Sec63